VRVLLGSLVVVLIALGVWLVVFRLLYAD